MHGTRRFNPVSASSLLRQSDFIETVPANIGMLLLAVLVRVLIVRPSSNDVTIFSLMLLGLGKACAWTQVVVSRGGKAASKQLLAIESQMTPDQVSEARKLAKEISARLKKSVKQ